ncbi:MAG TPA: respiratory nitrate reductase subunit gamma, partial [Syntrophales bacterium]|nr:respiratory nitrate reductase subunit gamma [Syntrophales bacterium]
MGFYFLTYLCVGAFILATGYRIYRQITLPAHVRWELYPVQHESGTRAAYGGSYLEELNWWEKKYESSLFNELKYMAPEILFIRGLWKENRSLWWVSFPFHFGLYLMIATLGLLIVHACFFLWRVPAFAVGSTIGSLVDGLIVAAGWTGLILGNVGALGVLYKRLTDPALRNYSSFSDYFNILFIFLFFLSALISCLLGDPYLEGAKAYTFGLLTGGHTMNSYVPGQTIFGRAAIVLASLLVAYIPLTHMSHMFMKYFLYHNVRWDDAPNVSGGVIEAAILENLGLKPTWTAKHVDADGRK